MFLIIIETQFFRPGAGTCQFYGTVKPIHGGSAAVAPIPSWPTRPKNVQVR